MVGTPVGEHKIPVADMIARPGPWGSPAVNPTVFLQGGPMQGVPGGMADQLVQVRQRVAQREHQRVIVGGDRAHRGKVGEFSLIKLLGVAQGEEHRGVFGAQGWGEDALIGPNEIVGGDWIPVGPARRLPQVKGPLPLVGGYLPAFGGGGNRLAGLRMILCQPLHQTHDDIERLLAVGGLRIEIVGLGEVAEMERLGANAGIDDRFAAAAPRRGDKAGEGKSNSEGEMPKMRGNVHGKKAVKMGNKKSQVIDLAL